MRLDSIIPVAYTLPAPAQSRANAILNSLGLQPDRIRNTSAHPTRFPIQ